LSWYRQAAALAPQDAEIRVSLVRGMLLAWEQDLRPASPDSVQTLRRQEFREHAMAASSLVPDQDTDGQLVLGYAFRTLGDLPRATGVFDLDAIGLVNLVHGLNAGVDVGGNAIEEATNYFIGVGVNPFAAPLDRELARLRWKVLAGADYAITQPVFDVDRFVEFLPKAEELRLPIIAGVWPLVSLRNAEFLASEIPGIYPRVDLEKLGYEVPADQQQAGLRSPPGSSGAAAILGLRGIQFSIPLAATAPRTPLTEAQ
jgi:hypothetical protein